MRVNSSGAENTTGTAHLENTIIYQCQAWNIYNLLLDLWRPYINSWLEHAPQPEAGAYELRETPSYSQALRRDSSDATCRGGKEKNMNPAAPETVAARSPGQHTPSRPPSPSAQLPSRLPRLSSTPTTHTPETVTKGNPGQQQRPAVPKSTATSGQSKPPARKNQQPTSSTNKQQPPAANSRRLQASSSREAQRDGAPTQTRLILSRKPVAAAASRKEQAPLKLPKLTLTRTGKSLCGIENHCKECLISTLCCSFITEDEGDHSRGTSCCALCL
ncbi:uncharacterized protein LOC142802676 [Rhipicephalus microplus]|uniref:uncharacterized protein LOC142802676 n=1 Tax=Rhipicephalus microplus TaxID=6941 RepID=UPI003F6A6261